MSSSDANHRRSSSSSRRPHRRRLQRQRAQRASSEQSRHQNMVLPVQSRSRISNVAASSVDPPPPPCPVCRRAEIEAEEDLFEQIEEMINRFLTVPGRRVPYNNIVRWTVDLGTIPDYSVVIIIRQPSSLV